MSILIPVLLIAGGLVAFVVGIVMMIEGDKSNNLFLGIPGFVVTCLGFIAAIVIGILWAVNYFSSLDAINDMQAFLDTRPAYEQAIAQAEGVEIKGADTGFVDIAYEAQAKAYTNLVVDYRNKIEWYNETLRQTRALNGTFLGIFRVDVPDDLKPIIVTIHEKDDPVDTKPEEIPAIPIKIIE